MTINRTKPRNWLLLGPCPCEHQTAHVRNEAVDALERGDIGMIAYRYLQSRAGQYQTRKEAILWSLDPVFGIPHSVANVGNTLRHKKTKRACKKALIDRLGPTNFDKLQKLNYPRGLQPATDLLDTLHVQTTELQRKVLCRREK